MTYASFSIYAVNLYNFFLSSLSLHLSLSQYFCVSQFYLRIRGAVVQPHTQRNKCILLTGEKTKIIFVKIYKKTTWHDKVLGAQNNDIITEDGDKSMNINKL